MPLAVQAVAPTLLMPKMLCTQFQQSRTLLVDENRYKDGSLQNRPLATTSRKSWKLAGRMTSAAIAALIAFFNEVQVQGCGEEFYFYDLYETSPKFSYDVTGISQAGLYIVTFTGPLQHGLDLGRSPYQCGLIEVS